MKQRKSVIKPVYSPTNTFLSTINDHNNQYLSTDTESYKTKVFKERTRNRNSGDLQTKRSLSRNSSIKINTSAYKTHHSQVTCFSPILKYLASKVSQKNPLTIKKVKKIKVKDIKKTMWCFPNRYYNNKSNASESRIKSLKGTENALSERSRKKSLSIVNCNTMNIIKEKEPYKRQNIMINELPTIRPFSYHKKVKSDILHIHQYTMGNNTPQQIEKQIVFDSITIPPFSLSNTLYTENTHLHINNLQPLSNNHLPIETIEPKIKNEKKELTTEDVLKNNKEKIDETSNHIENPHDSDRLDLPIKEEDHSFIHKSLRKAQRKATMVFMQTTVSNKIRALSLEINNQDLNINNNDNQINNNGNSLPPIKDSEEANLSPLNYNHSSHKDIVSEKEEDDSIKTINKPKEKVLSFDGITDNNLLHEADHENNIEETYLNRVFSFLSFEIDNIEGKYDINKEDKDNIIEQNKPSLQSLSKKGSKRINIQNQATVLVTKKDLHLSDKSFSSSKSNSNISIDDNNKQEQLSQESIENQSDSQNSLTIIPSRNNTIKFPTKNETHSLFSNELSKMAITYHFTQQRSLNQSNYCCLNIKEENNPKTNKLNGYIKKMKFISQFYYKEKDIIQSRLTNKSTILTRTIKSFESKYHMNHEFEVCLQTDNTFTSQSLIKQCKKHLHSQEAKLMLQLLILSFFNSLRFKTHLIWNPNYLNNQYFDVHKTLLHFWANNSKNNPAIVTLLSNTYEKDTLMANFSLVKRRTKRTKTTNKTGNYIKNTSAKNNHYIYSFIIKEFLGKAKSDYTHKTCDDIDFFQQEKDMIELKKKENRQRSQLEKIKQTNKRKGKIFNLTTECLLKQIKKTKASTNIEKKIEEENPLKNPEFFTLPFQKNRVKKQMMMELQRNFMRKQRKYKMESKMKNDFVSFQKAGFAGEIGLLSFHKANTLIQNIYKNVNEKDDVFDKVKTNVCNGFDTLKQAKRLYEYINAVDNDGNTLLMLSIRHSNTEIVKYLLDKGCDVNIANHQKDTALHLALRNKDFTIASLLINKEANEDAVNLEGLTPWNCANNAFYQ